MDTNKVIESVKATPMLDLLQTVFGSRTMSDSLLDGDNRLHAFHHLVATIHAYGLSPFFTVWVGEDEKNSAINIFQVQLIFFLAIGATHLYTIYSEIAKS